MDSTKQIAKYALASYVGYAALRKLTHDPDAKVSHPPVRKDSPKCLVIGCGISGICMSIKLSEKGIDHLVLEKESDVGGTWFLSNYPGVQCDVPSHGYCFSFEMNADWSKAYAGSKEIWAYLSKVSRKYGVYERTQFNTEVLSAHWMESDRKWVVETQDRKSMAKQTHIVDYLISGIGGLHIPQYPNVPGVGQFGGMEVHSAEWRNDVDLKNKRVVVVGSAASAVQLVPSIAEYASQVTCIQRTPNWLAPQKGPVLPYSLSYGPVIRWIFRNLPGVLFLHRLFIYIMMETTHWPLNLFSGGSDGVGQTIARKVLTKYMMSQLKGNQELAEKVIPKYAVGCKRIIRSERFLPALLRPNVELVTDKLAKVEKDGIVLDTKQGPRKIEADVVVYATGYEVGSLGRLQLKGCSDHIVSGSDMINKAMDTYYGMCHPMYPNSFLMLGPNTGLGHNSIIIMIETQANFISRTIELAANDKVERLAVRMDEVDRCMRYINETMEGTVWKAGKCNSWYQNKDGKVPTIWPATTARYMMDCLPPNDLHIFDCEKKGQTLRTDIAKI